MHFTLDSSYIYSIVSLSGFGRDDKEKYINAKKRTNSHVELLVVTVPLFLPLCFVRIYQGIKKGGQRGKISHTSKSFYTTTLFSPSFSSVEVTTKKQNDKNKRNE